MAFRILTIVAVLCMAVMPACSEVHVLEDEHEQMKMEYGIAGLSVEVSADVESTQSIQPDKADESATDEVAKPPAVPESSDSVQPADSPAPKTRQMQSISEVKPVITEVTEETPTDVKAEVTDDESPTSRMGFGLDGERSRPDKIAMLAEAETQATQQVKAEAMTAGDVISTIAKLILVLALAYFTILGLKWLSNRREIIPGGSQDLKVTETLRLSPNNSIHIVNVRGKNILVGCSTGQLTMLQELGEDEPSDDMPQSGRFAEYLAKYSGTTTQTGPTGRIAGLLRDCTDYLRNRQARMLDAKED